MESVVAKRDPRGQGDRGEVNAAMWFLAHGAAVFTPLLHCCRDFDFIVDRGGAPERVQVKTSTQFVDGRWRVSVCTRGGNRSWSGLVKYLDPSRYDYLFVVVADGRRWLIPAEKVEATTAVGLGGPKYEAYEIDPGEPLVATLDR